MVRRAREASGPAEAAHRAGRVPRLPDPQQKRDGLRLLWTYIRLLSIRSRQYARRFSRNANLDAPPAFPMLAIYVKGDEAYLWLNFIGKVGGWLQKLGSPAFYRAAGLAALGLVVYLLVRTPLPEWTMDLFMAGRELAPRWYQSIIDFAHPVVVVINFLFVALLAALVAAIVVLALMLTTQVAVALLLRVVAGGRYSFGSLPLFDLLRNWSVRQRVTKYPVGSLVEPVPFEELESAAAWKLGLRHSRPWASPAVATKIASWIVATLPPEA